MQTDDVTTMPTEINDMIDNTRRSRNASFELVRIIAMLFIVSVHFIGHGGWLNNTIGVNYVFIKIIQTLFRPSVNLFVIIGAYFMCARDDMNVNVKKLLKLYLTVFFYSVTLYVIFLAAGIYTFNADSLIDTLFPIVRNKYWFFSSYFFMMLASPLLNVVIHRLTKKQYAVLCVVLIVIASLQDFNNITTSSIPLSDGYNTIWFIFLYFIGGYIRKYDVTLTKTQWIIGFILFIGVIAFTYFLFEDYTSINVIYMTLFIFITAKQHPIKNATVSKVICFISSLTFGVYLIHESPELRGYMYQNIFKSYAFYDSEYAFLIMIGFILLTFITCAAIEYLRQLLFKGVGLCVKKIKSHRNKKNENIAL